YLLVAPGKHGADGMMRRFEGQPVKLRGEVIRRDGRQMIQASPESVAIIASANTVATPVIDEGEQTLTGEIVDTKCFLGVMNPGEGKVHRDCAARCISGGLPAALATPAGELYLLVTPGRKPLGRELLPFVAEPVRVRGHVLQSGKTRWLAAELPGVERAEN